MIKISQMPVVGKYTGQEVSPIVQDGVTVKAPLLFTDSEQKVHMPEGVALVTSVEGSEINLISAKVVDGVVTVFVGDKEVSLYKDSSIIVTESAIADGNAYLRINNKWSIRNPITQINDLSAPTGGGKLTIAAADIKAHVENAKRDGVSYVSRDGEWITLADGIQVELDKKADVIHTHAISDVTGLQAALEGKANAVHTHTTADVTGLDQELTDIKSSITNQTHPIADITGLQSALNGLNTDIEAVSTAKADKVHKHAIADVTGLQTKLDSIDGKVSTVEDGINEVKERLQTAMFYSRDTGFTGSEASGKLPVTMKAGRKMSVADSVISVTEEGTYRVDVTAKIASDGTIVTLTGVPDMIIETKGYGTVSGIFDLSTSSKLTLTYTGANSIVDSNIVIHKI